MGIIRVLVVEDERHVREALAGLIESEETLPGGGGSRAAREILRQSPETRVLALSAFEDRTTVLDMLRAGAVGYLVKGTAPEEIVRAIERAARGQSSLSAEVMGSVVAELSTQLPR